MSDPLNVITRTETGTLRMKRLRKSGQIPAVLYGHGQDTMLLSVSQRDLQRAIDHRSHIVDLTGSVSESALLKDVQWDAFGIGILHLDLTRIDATEVVEVTLPIELKGDAPGTHNGGVVKFLRHEVTIACPANQLPDKIEVRINDLELDTSITAGEVVLPDGATLVGSASEVIVSCSVPDLVSEEVTETVDGAEPEVIGAKETDEEEAE